MRQRRSSCWRSDSNRHGTCSMTLSLSCCTVPSISRLSEVCLDSCGSSTAGRDTDNCSSKAQMRTWRSGMVMSFRGTEAGAEMMSGVARGTWIRCFLNLSDGGPDERSRRSALRGSGSRCRPDCGHELRVYTSLEVLWTECAAAMNGSYLFCPSRTIMTACVRHLSKGLEVPHLNTDSRAACGGDKRCVGCRPMLDVW